MIFTEKTVMTSNHVVDNTTPSITETIITQLLPKLTHTKQTSLSHNFSPTDSMPLNQTDIGRLYQNNLKRRKKNPCDSNKLELAKEKKGTFCIVYFVQRTFFQHFCFISVYIVLHTFSKYTYFCISKNITSYTFLLVFKIIESLQCILNAVFCGWKNLYFELIDELKIIRNK